MGNISKRNDAMSAIVIQNLGKKYGRVVAVDDLNLTVAPGELVAFIGPNGAGKSTTLKMLTGQLIPTSGSIELGGVDVLADPGLARQKTTQWDHGTTAVSYRRQIY